MKLKRSEIESVNAPEKLSYSRYYEHDGALRAYANRAMLLAFICVPATLLAVGLAAYVRMQPPTVIRVDANGETAVVLPKSSPAKAEVTVAQGVDTAPSELERKAFVRNFLDHYLNFSPDSVDHNWADALNAMTANLRHEALASMQKDNTVGRVQDEGITSVFHLRQIDPVKDDSLSFTVFGVKEIHRLKDHQEASEKLVGEYHIRLSTEKRTEQNPTGLLIADYREKLIEGEKQDARVESSSVKQSN